MPAALAGSHWSWRHNQPLAAFALVLAALSFAFAAAYRVPDRAIYLLPAYLGYTLLAGAGVVAAWEAIVTLPKRQRAPLIAGASLAVAILSGVWTARGFLDHDLHGDTTPRVFAEAVLLSLPLHARLETARDDTSFTLRYAQQALGLRPDVTVVDVRIAADGGAR